MEERIIALENKAAEIEGVLNNVVFALNFYALCQNNSTKKLEDVAKEMNFYAASKYADLKAFNGLEPTVKAKTLIKQQE